MATSYKIAKKLLPTWHYAYVANSNDMIDLNEVIESGATSSSS